MTLVPVLPRQTVLRTLQWLLLPTLADLLVAMALLRHYFLMPGGWGKLLADANIGLQVRAGDLIRASGELPVTDPFTFTHPDRVWYAWEWLFDVLASLVHAQFGLPALAVIALFCITASLAFSYVLAVRRSESWAIPAVLLLLGTGASSIHFLARPHLTTWVFLAVSLGGALLERTGRPAKLWWIPLLALVWANLHGGFFLLIVCLSLVAAGQWLEGRRTIAVRYAALTAATLLATLANPYGWRLHAHILEFMRSGWVLQSVQEFLPPSPALGFAYWFHIAWVCLCCVAGYRCWRRRGWTDLMLIAFFAFSACRSARHIPLMVIATLPLLAGELVPLWRQACSRSRRSSLLQVVSDVESDMLPQFARMSLSVPVLLTCALLAPGGFGLANSFPPDAFPVAMAEAHWSRLAKERVFTTDAWGDYLVYRGAPGLRVWVTGNNDYLGPEVGQQYLSVLEGRPEAQRILSQQGFQLALVPVDKPICRWFRQQPGWRWIGEDRVAALFERVKP